MREKESVDEHSLDKDREDEKEIPDDLSVPIAQYKSGALRKKWQKKEKEILVRARARQNSRPDWRGDLRFL